jgi:hypothetical protein
MATTRRSARTGGSSTANRRQVSGSTAPAAAVDDTQVLSTGDWREEYGYVLSDLRKLLLTSGVLLVAIIVIGFFI